MGIYADNAARFATTREDHATLIENTIQTGLHKATRYYRLGRRGWARGEWELVLLGRLLAQLTGDRASAEALADLRLVPGDPAPAGVTALVAALDARKVATS